MRTRSGSASAQMQPPALMRRSFLRLSTPTAYLLLDVEVSSASA